MNNFETDFVCDPEALKGLSLDSSIHLCIDFQDAYFSPKGKLIKATQSVRDGAVHVTSRIQSLYPVFNTACENKTLWVWHECVGDKFYKVDPPADMRFAKRWNSAFSRTNLDANLRSGNIDTLFLSGGYARQCVRSTALDALRLGYNVVVLTDCIQDTHDVCLSKTALKLEFKLPAGPDGQERHARFTTSEALKSFVKGACPEYTYAFA